MTENPEKFYSENSEQFAEEYSIEKMPQDYLDLLNSFVEKVENGRVLDAGCGSGRDTQYLTKEGLEVIGIDRAKGMIEYAKKSKEGTFHRMDIRDLDFENEEFEGIWCNTVIHFFNPEKMSEILEELKRVVKSDGIFYISFKIGEGTFTREEYGEEVKQYLIPEKKAREMLEEKGLEIKEVKKAEVKGTEIMNVITEVG